MDRKRACVEIRVPFCKGHCVFCHDACLGENVGYLHRYLRALEKEIEGAGEDLREYELETVYLRWDGISLPGVGALDGFLRKIRDCIAGVDGKVPWIVNLMPWELTEEMVYVLRHRHNVESVVLKMMALSREGLSHIHAPMTLNLAEHALEWRRPEGWNVVEEFLIGVPGQTGEELRNWLKRGMQLEPTQVSLRRFHDRHLNLEQQVQYAKETDWDGLIAAAQETLAGFGLERKGKTLDFARPDRWIRTDRSDMDLFGFGLGACSRLDGFAYHNTTDFSLYVEHSDEPDVIGIVD